MRMLFLHLTHLVLLFIFSWHQCLFLYFLMLDGVPEHNEKSLFYFWEPPSLRSSIECCIYGSGI
jgi:hypothetical protein